MYVALSGDGGDQLFAGYPTYQAHPAARALTKVDRASMACSVEVRVPLLDRRVIHLAAILPDSMKLRRAAEEGLRRSGRAVVPRRARASLLVLALWTARHRIAQPPFPEVHSRP